MFICKDSESGGLAKRGGVLVVVSMPETADKLFSLLI
jgi:hypothetical protein